LIPVYLGSISSFLKLLLSDMVKARGRLVKHARRRRLLVRVKPTKRRHPKMMAVTAKKVLALTRKLKQERKRRVGAEHGKKRAYYAYKRYRGRTLARRSYSYELKKLNKEWEDRQLVAVQADVAAVNRVAAVVGGRMNQPAALVAHPPPAASLPASSPNLPTPVQLWQTSMNKGSKSVAVGGPANSLDSVKADLMNRFRGV